MFNAGILAGVVLDAINREIGSDRELRLDGDNVVYINNQTGEEKEITLSSVLEALDRTGNDNPGLNLEALAEKTAEKVLEKLSSPEYTVPIRVDASALKALFKQ